MLDTAPHIDPAVVQTYGAVKLAHITVSDVVVGDTPPRLKKIARRVEQDLRTSIRPGEIGDALSSWELLGHRMGLSDIDELPAPRALVEDVLAGRNMPKINCVVDSANITALTHLTPVGVFDLDRLEPPITLRCAGEDEEIVPILASEPVKCHPSEIVYTDRSRVFSRYSRDADFSKITSETRNILCVIDGTPEMTSEYLLTAAAMLVDLLTDVCGPSIQVKGPALAELDGKPGE